MINNPFNPPKTVAEIKSIWMKLVFKYHPDTSGYDSKEDFQNLNNWYHEALKGNHKVEYKNTQTGEPHTYYYNYAKEQGAIDAVDRLIKAGFSQAVTIDLVGSWVWVHGIKFGSADFKVHQSLSHPTKKKKGGKAASFLTWHSKRKLYYWKPEGAISNYNPSATYKDLQSMYGSEVFKPEEENTQKQPQAARIAG